MTFKPDFKTLPARQQKIWPHLSAAKDLGFCLYGGTALALRFGHRESVDFDFFSSKDVNKDHLARRIPLIADAIAIQDSANTYVVLATPAGSEDSVKLSFFGGFEFGRVAAPQLSDDGVLLVASVRDLMATKLKVLFDRVEPKDYIDIAEMLARGYKLDEGINDALALFPRLSPGICLKTLGYFDLPQLAGLTRECRQTLSSQSSQTYQNTAAFSASPLVSSDLMLSPQDMAAEMAASKIVMGRRAVAKKVPKLRP